MIPDYFKPIEPYDREGYYETVMTILRCGVNPYRNITMEQAQELVDLIRLENHTPEQHQRNVELQYLCAKTYDDE